jgi:putative Mg2+ transporter-C (MgtC) family protein
MDEDKLRALIGGKGFDIANLSSRLTDAGETFEYRMMIRSRDRHATEELSKHLRGLSEVTEFRISPTGD